jgi:hypothetical protein
MTQSFILMALGIGIGVDRAAYRLAMQSALGAGPARDVAHASRYLSGDIG